MRIAVQDRTDHTRRFYFADLTIRQVKLYDNGAMISIGLTVPDDLRPSTLKRWVNNGTARETTREAWNHAGCQSSCVTRGGATCRW